MPRPLIVYYSRSGKTRGVAEILAGLLDADIEEIREKKDRGGKVGYVGGIKDALLKRPAELASIPSPVGREMVILAMPVWASSPPPAVSEYVKAVDLSGTKVAAFCTYDGGGSKSLLKKLTEIVPGGLVETMGLKKPRHDDPALKVVLQDWADRVKQAIGPP